MNEIGNKIKFFREQLGFNQAELAFRASLSQSQISEFESGKSIPKIDKLLKIADALGQSVGVFDERLLHTSKNDGKKLPEISPSKHADLLRRHFWRLFDQLSIEQREQLLAMMLQCIEDNLEEMAKLSKK